MVSQEYRFPDPRRAAPDGLVAVGGDLSVPRLVEAYRNGIFPWSANPITWWSPDPRGVLRFEQLHISRSLTRVLKSNKFTVTRDRSFQSVVAACASAPRREGITWISPEFVEAYAALFRAGHAHSIECWCGNQLAGGLYGVAVGGVFAGESMFHHVTDASKVAVVALVQHLKSQGFTVLDTQMVTPATRSLGATEVSRETYLAQLDSVRDHQVFF